MTLRDFNLEIIELLLKLFKNVRFIAIFGIILEDYCQFRDTTVKTLYLAKEPGSQRTWWYYLDRLRCDQVRALENALEKLLDMWMYPEAPMPCVVDGIHDCRPGLAELITTEYVKSIDRFYRSHYLFLRKSRLLDLRWDHVDLIEWSQNIRRFGKHIHGTPP